MITNDEAAEVATILVLKRLDNAVLAASMLPLSNFGKINPMNLAFKPMLEENLIKEDGKPVDNIELLLKALNYEINDRIHKEIFE